MQTRTYSQSPTCIVQFADRAKVFPSRHSTIQPVAPMQAGSGKLLQPGLVHVFSHKSNRRAAQDDRIALLDLAD